MKGYIINAILISLIFLFSCAKKEQIAPDLGVISGPVTIENAFAVSNANPNFSVKGTTVYFSATFKEETYWVITIKGNTTGAVKKIERSGNSGTVISSADATWDGYADNTAQFGVETAIATLSFPYSNTAPVTLTMHIAGIK